MRAFILEAVVRSASLVGAGSGPFRSKIFFRLRKERARVAHIEQDPIKQIEILAQRFDTSPKKMERLLHRLETKDVSLNTKIFGDTGLSLIDTLVSDIEPQDLATQRREEQRVLRKEVDNALNSLDSRERYIVENRLLQNKEDEMTLAALGRELGVSRERARQLEVRAKKKLRAQLHEFAE